MLLFLMDVDYGCDWILIQILLIDSLVKMPTCVTNIAGITPATFKIVNKWLFVDQRGIDFFMFEIFSNFQEMKNGHKSMFNSLPRSLVRGVSWFLFLEW